MVAQQQQNNLPAPRPKSWSEVLTPQITALAERLYHDTPGSTREHFALAARDYLEHQTETLELKSVEIGGVLNVIKDTRSYEPLGYPSLEAFLDGERISNIGKSQAYKYMWIARRMETAALSAPQQSAPRLIDPRAARLSITPDMVREHGTEKVYMLSVAWEHRSPEERQEMLASMDVPTRDFREVSHGQRKHWSFSIDGDMIMMWDPDGHGTPVAKLLTTKPAERALIEDRLGTRPQGRS